MHRLQKVEDQYILLSITQKMEFNVKTKAILAALTAAGLMFSLSGCGSSESGSAGGSDAAAEITESTPGVITAFGGEPQTGLIPPMINEVNGGKIADLIWAGLFYYDEKGNAVPEIADSVESKDEGKTWDVKLKDGWKFTDGTPITSDTFIKSWQYGALASNGCLSSEFFSPIEGWNADEDSELTGLKKVSDTEFTITLTEADPDFPKRLGYSAFYPMPPEKIADKAAAEAYGQAPVTNGPYTLQKWEHNTQVVLAPNPDYKGGRTVANKGIVLKLYTDDAAAYNDLLAGNLDVLDAIPGSALSTFRTDLGDRAIDQGGALWQSFTIPGYLPHFAFDEEGQLRRQAISMAIDRKEITDTIFEGTRKPATDFIAPVIPGHVEELKGGEVLKFNPEKAKELWAKANAISPWNDTFELAYNADSSAHKAWVEAVCNQIKNNLEISAEPKPYATFKELRAEASDGKLTSALRTGWQADYPSGYNFLGPLYRAGAGSNDARYDNPAFEEALMKAVAAKTPEEADKLYTAAQEILIKDLPAIPLWDQNALGGYSDKVKNVKIGWNTVPLFHLITKE